MVTTLADHAALGPEASRSRGRVPGHPRPRCRRCERAAGEARRSDTVPGPTRPTASKGRRERTRRETPSHLGIRSRTNAGSRSRLPRRARGCDAVSHGQCRKTTSVAAGAIRRDIGGPLISETSRLRLARPPRRRCVIGAVTDGSGYCALARFLSLAGGADTSQRSNRRCVGPHRGCHGLNDHCAEVWR